MELFNDQGTLSPELLIKFSQINQSACNL